MLQFATGFRNVTKPHFLCLSRRGAKLFVCEQKDPDVGLDFYNGSMMTTTMSTMITTAMSTFAVVVACFALWVSAEKLRLDLYNKRFDIYLRTLKFQQALFQKVREDGTLAALHADFMIASRESRFLFSSESGVYDQLRRLHEASVAIMREMPKDLPPEYKSEHQEERSAAIVLWFGPGLTKLEDLMAQDLNFHDAFLPWALLGRMRGRKNAA